MANTATIVLDKPIIGHEGEIRKIVLREPTFDEYLTIGDPYEIGQSREGINFTVQNPDAVRSYIETCLFEPKDPLLLKQAPAKVARKVRLAVLGFFHDGDEETEASKTSPTT